MFKSNTTIAVDSGIGALLSNKIAQTATHSAVKELLKWKDKKTFPEKDYYEISKYASENCTNSAENIPSVPLWHRGIHLTSFKKKFEVILKDLGGKKEPLKR